MENEVVKNTPPHDSVEDKQPPIRSVLCLKNKKRISEFEKFEDCFMLNFDPYESSKFSTTLSKCLKQEPENEDDSVDSKLTIVAERGKVACRDFPHSRHQCVKHPSSKTPHESYCNLCYCYVCDTAAPCAEWPEHCQATHTSDWRSLRRQKRGQDSDSDSEPDYAPNIVRYIRV